MWAFMLKSFALKDWMAFLDAYGVPWRVGKWHAGANDDDKRALLRAVARIAADGAAIIPDSMAVELLEAEAGPHTDAFEKICRYLDEQVSKAVLGQTMTADRGSSRAQAIVHNDVRLDIGRADADELAATLQRDLIEPFVLFNHGRPKNGFPKLTLPVVKPKSLQALMEATAEFVDRGGKVSMAELRDKLGWADPADDEELLVPIGHARAKRPRHAPRSAETAEAEPSEWEAVSDQQT
jgi:phage gp29-like protein